MSTEGRRQFIPREAGDPDLTQAEFKAQQEGDVRTLKMRNNIAKQLKATRREERKRITEMVLDRNGREYIEYFEGITSMFEYVKSLPSNTILDIGAGRGRGIRELAESALGEGLRFKTTVLGNSDRIEKSDAIARVHITPAETLRGISNESIGGILALYSISYCENPEIVTKRIDEVLVPGGVVKATFPDLPGRLSRTSKFIQWDALPYEHFFKGMGYDVLVHSSQRQILLALKPGGNISASKLMEADEKSYEEQMAPFPETEE
jgi:SAM-dependent methyltransferase